MPRVKSEGKRGVAAAMIALILPACQSQRDDSVLWETERERIELTQQLKLAEYRLGLNRSGDPGELEQVEETVRELGRRATESQRNGSILRAEIKDMEVRNEELVRLAIQSLRTKALGRKYDTFSARNGRSFENVAITGVDDSGVAIRHEHGTARLRFSELSPEQCALFGLDERSAMAAEDREWRESITYERRIDGELNAMREKEEEIAAVARRSEDSRSFRAQMAVNSATRQTRPLARAASPVGSGSSYRYSDGYSRYRSYRPTYRYVYYYPSAPNPFYGSRACRIGFYNPNSPTIP